MNNDSLKIAYFSAEIGIRQDIKTYSGGLGILAGDTIKAMADLEVPSCAVTLLYKYGFLKQKIIDNIQTEEDDPWDFMKILEDTKKFTYVKIYGQDVKVKIWKYEYEGASKSKVPIFFLDTDLHENPQWARPITNKLYQGDRISQEMVLGIGGIRALRALGINKIEKYHMNEGHSAFLTLELYQELGKTIGWDNGLVKDRCVFTTHTPIPAGHDNFSYDEIGEHFKDTELLPWHIRKMAGQERFNMTQLAMGFSSSINAVSKKHREVSEGMFPCFTIKSITNGVHIDTWIDPNIKDLFDKEIKGWSKDNMLLCKIFDVDTQKLLEAKQKAKDAMIDFINSNNVVDSKLKNDILTIGFARRFIEYKDAELIFKNLDNLRRLSNKVQFVFAGKSHSSDGIGKNIMKRIINHADELKDEVNIAFIENYNMEISKKLVSGCDMWLNTPVPPNEASGTSGMKAASNGTLHFSRLDGWAIEGFERNGGGFPISEYSDFIMNLRYKIIPMFYSVNKSSWADQMKLSIGNCGSYFNTHRMVREYVEKMYKIKL